MQAPGMGLPRPSPAACMVQAQALGLDGAPLTAAGVLAGAQQAYQLGVRAVLMPGVGAKFQDADARPIRVHCALQVGWKWKGGACLCVCARAVSNWST